MTPEEIAAKATEEAATRAEAEKTAANAAKVDKSEHDKVLARLAEFEKAEAKRAEAAKTAEEAEALKRGDHEKLLVGTKAERDAAMKRADELEARIAEFDKAEKARTKALAAKNATRIEKIPKDRQSLVPAGLSPEATADYLETNWELLTGGEVAHGAGPRARIRTDGEIPAAIVLEAESRRMDPKEWADIVKVAEPGRWKKLTTAAVEVH